jgi:uncharacterized damage-inducible protein DinB
MLKRHLLITLFMLLFNMVDSRAQAYFDAEFLDVWLRTTKYTLEVADKMPDSLYNYGPSLKSMTFKEQQLHIVGNISFLTNYITGKKQVFYQVNQLNDLYKEGVLEILTASLQYVQQLIKENDKNSIAEMIVFQGVKMSKENIFYLINNHLSHHRAQAILYLRMNQIDPPAYVGW